MSEEMEVKNSNSCYVQPKTDEEQKSSLDDMVDGMFNRLCAAVGDNIHEPTFHGFGVDEIRDPNTGKLLRLSFVPVDLLDGMPIRRMDR